MKKPETEQTPVTADEIDKIEKLIGEYRRDELPGADKPFHHEAEIASGMKYFIMYLRERAQGDNPLTLGL
jgi:hypothetical protein